MDVERQTSYLKSMEDISTQENKTFYTSFRPVEREVQNVQFEYMEDEQEFAVDYTSTVWPLQSSILCQDNFHMLVGKIAPFAEEYQNMDDYRQLKIALSDARYDSLCLTKRDTVTTATSPVNHCTSLPVQHELKDNGDNDTLPSFNNEPWSFSGLCSLRSFEFTFDYGPPDTNEHSCKVKTRLPVQYHESAICQENEPWPFAGLCSLPCSEFIFDCDDGTCRRDTEHSTTNIKTTLSEIKVKSNDVHKSTAKKKSKHLSRLRRYLRRMNIFSGAICSRIVTQLTRPSLLLM